MGDPTETPVLTVQNPAYTALTSLQDGRAGSALRDTGKAFGAVLLATALLASGCDSDSGGDDLPTTAQAAKDVSVWMEEFETNLTDGTRPLKRWQTTEDGSTDLGPDCDEGKARRTYVATIDVPDSIRPPDAGDHQNQLWGRLLSEAWDPSTSGVGDVAGIVTASRAEDDPTGTTLTVVFSPVAGGWHYHMTARTGCLPTD